MFPAPCPLAMEPPVVPDRLHVGRRTPLALVLHARADHPGPVLLRQVRCDEPDIVLDDDLFQRDTRLMPGETYHTTLFLTARRPGTFDLGKFSVQADLELYPLPSRPLAAVPSLADEVELTLEPVCSYEHGRKVQLRLRHRGATELADLRLTLRPAAAVRAGVGTRHVGRFLPGEEQRLDLLLAGERVEVLLTARGAGLDLDARLELPVPEGGPQAGVQAFRFLEPRRLSTDHIDLRPADREDHPLAPRQGVYFLEGRKHYRVIVRPSHPRASQVRLRELPERIHLVPGTTRILPGRWEFEVFVPSNDWISHSGRLFYDVTTPDGTQTGEIHVAVEPPRFRRWQIAGALGVAITLQSVLLLGKLALGLEPDWAEALADFNPFNGPALGLWRLVSIPGIWLGLVAFDRLQYRWHN